MYSSLQNYLRSFFLLYSSICFDDQGSQSSLFGDKNPTTPTTPRRPSRSAHRSSHSLNSSQRSSLDQFWSNTFPQTPPASTKPPNLPFPSSHTQYYSMNYDS